MIHEYANDRDERRKLFDDLCRSSRIDVAGAPFVKIKTDSRGAQQRGVARDFEICNAADLYACHSKPRSAATGSFEVRKCSPIRKASAPASTNRATSSVELTPLSTT